MKEYQKSKLNRVKRGANRASYDVATIHTILDAGFIGYVSYIYQDTAITLPMSYGRKNDKIYLHSSTGNRMLLALLKAKKASMTVMHLDALVLARSGFHHSVNYRSATLFCSVKELTNTSEKEASLKCLMEQMMQGRFDGVRPIITEELNRTLVVEMTIETASAKIRGVGVIDESEDENLPIWAGLVPLKQVATYPVSDDKLAKGIKIPKHVLDYYEQHKA